MPVPQNIPADEERLASFMQGYKEFLKDTTVIRTGSDEARVDQRIQKSEEYTKRVDQLMQKCEDYKKKLEEMTRTELRCATFRNGLPYSSFRELQGINADKVDSKFIAEMMTHKLPHDLPAGYIEQHKTFHVVRSYYHFICEAVKMLQNAMPATEKLKQFSRDLLQVPNRYGLIYIMEVIDSNKNNKSDNRYRFLAGENDPSLGQQNQAPDTRQRSVSRRP